MKRNHFLIAVFVVAAMSVATAPAGAQGRRDEERQRGGVRVVQSGPAPRHESVPRAVPRASENRQTTAPQVMAQRAPRAFENRQPPVQQVAPLGNGGRQVAPRAVPRTNDRFQSPGPRPDQGRGFVQPRGRFNGYDARRYVRPYGFEPYHPFRFGQPYYSFRPRVRLGFGLWIGFGVPYPWSYYGGYLPRVYGYYPDGYYYPSVGAYDYGGLSFDIQPSDADLYVDGEYVGTVGTFTPYGEPLTLAPGVHEITIERDGYQTMQWEATIVPGQVIPYQGAMEPW